jgi:TPR repeat protein
MKNTLSVFALVLVVSLPALAVNEDLFLKMERLAQQGDPEAQYHLGMFYNNGIGTAKNPKRAFEWFKKSASGADPLGNYKLGCYYDGQGQGIISLDADKALQYKRVAARAGYSLAQYDVAMSLLDKGNTAEAIQWLQKAGDQGSFSGLYTLHNFYYHGKYIDKDAYKAYLYLSLAAKVTRAEMPAKMKDVLDRLSTTISQEEKSKADKIISGWQPLPSQLTIKAFNGLREAKDYIHKQR